MSEPQPAQRLACLIVARNLGDAVIQSCFLEALAARGYAREYLVWTRPQVAFLFRDIVNCEVVCSQFPVGTTKQFGGLEVGRFLRAAWQIRRRRPSVTLDLIGDFRERFFARLAGSPRHLHIGWARGHPFARIIRNPLGPGRPVVTVPVNRLNVYEAHELMLDALMPSPAAGGPNPSAPMPVERRLRVGLHPFASQKCKLWPMESWRRLVRELLDRGAEVVVFGAPTERQSMLELLGGELRERVILVAESLESFARHTATLDVMIGLDSFSVHMARRQGVRSITINAGNPPGLWSVPAPLGRTLASSGGCPHYPCFNVPKCVGRTNEYACVKSISVGQVLSAIDS